MIEWLNFNIGFVTTIGISITALVGIISIIAIFRSPIIALRTQKKIEEYEEKNKRKLDIFKTLLATRANITSLEHVQALNMIDIEFYEEKKITQLWNIYRDHLNSYPQNGDKFAIESWAGKRPDYFTDLLHGISNFLGYEFDRIILKKGAYIPQAHGDLSMEQDLIRRGIVNLLQGETHMKIQVIDNRNKFENNKN
jgi:hypothetical protein